MPDDSRTIPAAAIDVAGRSDPSSPLGGSVRPRRLVWRIARDPLLHFCLLGGLIFAADRIVHPTAKDEKVIVVSKAMRDQISRGYTEDGDRAATEQELRNRIDNWVASEILYREGRALGMERGDDMIRNRIAYKLQLMIFDNVRVDQPTNAELEEWFAQNHARYDRPETVGFYYTDATDEATARRQLEDIRAGRESTELEERAHAILARPVSTLDAAFGDGFRAALLALPLEQWSLIRSKDGWHCVRLDSHRDGEPAKLEEVQDDARRVWHDEKVRKQAWDAVNRLKASYKVVYE